MEELVNRPVNYLSHYTSKEKAVNVHRMAASSRMAALGFFMGWAGMGYMRRDLGLRIGGPYKNHDPHFAHKKVRRRMASKSRIYNLVRGV